MRKNSERMVRGGNGTSRDKRGDITIPAAVHLSERDRPYQTVGVALQHLTDGLGLALGGY